MADGHVYWITGLSGSGKSTLAYMLVEWLGKRNLRPVLLDGDAIRELLLEPSGHDRESRFRIAKFNGRLCRFLSLQGFTVVCPTISLFHEVQSWNRKNVPGYTEIFLDVPLTELKRRDPKGIYARAERGELKEVVGIDIVAELPLHPDLCLSVTAGTTPPDLFDRITNHIEAAQK